MTPAPPGTRKACVFCAIARRAAPAAIVAETEACVAFLDVKPLFHGHVLVVPRVHAATIVDLDPGAIEPLFGLVRRLGVAVRDGMGAEGTFVAINNTVSQSVPHLHVHVVPRTKGDGLRGFFWPRTRYDDDGAMERARAAIAAALPQD